MELTIKVHKDNKANYIASTLMSWDSYITLKEEDDIETILITFWHTKQEYAKYQSGKIKIGKKTIIT